MVYLIFIYFLLFKVIIVFVKNNETVKKYQCFAEEYTKKVLFEFVNTNYLNIENCRET